MELIMNDRDWEILKVLHEKLNVTQAAKALYISQPALTLRLQQIEENFGVKIAQRGRRGVVFTPQGEYLVKYAKEMILQLQNTREQIWNMEKCVTGVLRLGSAGSFACYKLPALLSQFISKYPKVEFNVTTGWSSDVVELLYRNEVHIGIIRGDQDWPEQKHLIMEEPLYIVSKNKITTEELPFLPRIDYQTDPSLKSTIDSWWIENYSQSPMVTMKVDRLETCRELVYNGLGYAIMPGLTLKDRSNIFTIDLMSKDRVPIRRNTWLIYRKESLNLTLIKTFVDFISNA